MVIGVTVPFACAVGPTALRRFILSPLLITRPAPESSVVYAGRVSGVDSGPLSTCGFVAGTALSSDCSLVLSPSVCNVGLPA